MAPRKPSTSSAADAPLTCACAADWLAWLSAQHAASAGVWLIIGKKGGPATVSYAEAVEGALIWGWIDGQKRPLDAGRWLQRFTPRTARSAWSKINRDKAEALLAAGKLAAPGLAEVERARRDGRWERAYDSPRTASVPEDLQAALAGNRKAQAAFAALDGANRYAILYRVQTAKKPQTRARRVAELTAMLARGETIHPRKRPR